MPQLEKLHLHQNIKKFTFIIEVNCIKLILYSIKVILTRTICKSKIINVQLRN